VDTSTQDNGSGERRGRIGAMITPWHTVTQRIIRSVEAPDYDTRVPRTSRPPMRLIMGGIAAVALAGLFFVWWGGDSTGWFMFWVLLAIYTPFLVVWYITEIRRTSGPDHWWDSDEALVVRIPAIAGDDKIAPLAQTQPVAPTGWPDAADSVRISGLYRPERLIPQVVSSHVTTIAVGGVLGGVLGGAYIAVSLFFGYVTHGALFFPWQVSLLGGILIAQSLWALTQWLPISQPFSVVADAQGLTWRRGGKLHTLPWSQAQALCMIELPPIEAQGSRSADATQRIYWMQGPDGALTWAPEPRRRWSRVSSAPSAPEAPDDQAWRLCALAAKRTGLPLRDLTATTAHLLPLWSAVNLIQQALETGPSIPISEAEQRRIETQRATRRRQIRAHFGLGAALNLILLAAAAAMLVGLPRVYSDQLTQAARSAPIFADSLASPSGQWPDATKPDAIFVYRGGVYVATGGANACCDLFALATPTVRDGVIEVTLHQVNDLDFSEAGLVLRADPTTHEALVFTITPGGGWRLERFTLKADGSGDQEGGSLINEGLLFPVSAIHHGSDVTNRLAVIMRGASYTFFVNGQYIGSYHDGWVAGEQVGVYAGGPTAFSDFAIYPAPPALVANTPGVSDVASTLNSFSVVC
jgi:hypothetical protein